MSNTDSNEIAIKSMETGQTRYVELSALIGLTKNGKVVKGHVGLNNNAIGRFSASGSHTIRVTKLSGGIMVQLSQTEFNTLLSPSSHRGGPHVKARLVIT